MVAIAEHRWAIVDLVRATKGKVPLYHIVSKRSYVNLVRNTRLITLALKDIRDLVSYEILICVTCVNLSFWPYGVVELNFWEEKINGDEMRVRRKKSTFWGGS